MKAKQLKSLTKGHWYISIDPDPYDKFQWHYVVRSRIGNRSIFVADFGCDEHAKANAQFLCKIKNKD